MDQILKESYTQEDFFYIQRKEIKKKNLETGKNCDGQIWAF